MRSPINFTIKPLISFFFGGLSTKQKKKLKKLHADEDKEVCTEPIQMARLIILQWLCNNRRTTRDIWGKQSISCIITWLICIPPKMLEFQSKPTKHIDFPTCQFKRMRIYYYHYLPINSDRSLDDNCGDVDSDNNCLLINCVHVHIRQCAGNYAMICCWWWWWWSIKVEIQLFLRTNRTYRAATLFLCGWELFG